MKNKIHISLLIGLIILFFTIMFLSTTLQNINVVYNFKNDTISNTGNNIKLGEIEVTNNGLIPTKIKLKTFVGCTFDNNSNNINEIYISYSNSKRDYINGQSNFFVELFSKEKKSYNIFTQYFPKIPNEKSIPLNKNFKLYLFDITKNKDNNNYLYEFCNGANKENFYKIINIEIKNE